MHLLIVVRELRLRRFMGGDDAEGHIHIAGVLRETGDGVAIINAAGSVGIGCLIPFKGFAHDLARGRGARAGACQIGIAQQHVIACAAFDVVVAAARIDIIIACARDHGVVAVKCQNDIVLGRFACKDRIAVVDLVAIGVAGIGNVDQVVAVVAFDITVTGISGDGFEMHIGDPDRLICAITIVIVDFDTGNGASDADCDRTGGIIGVDAAVVYVLRCGRIAGNGCAAGGGQGHGHKVSVGVIGADGHDILVVVMAGSAVQVIDAERHVGYFVTIKGIGGREVQRRGRGVINTPLAACAIQLQCRIIKGFTRRRILRGVVRGGRGPMILSVEIHADLDTASIYCHAAVHTCSVTSEQAPIQNLIRHFFDPLLPSSAGKTRPPR